MSYVTRSGISDRRGGARAGAGTGPAPGRPPGPAADRLRAPLRQRAGRAGLGQGGQDPPGAALGAPLAGLLVAPADVTALTPEVSHEPPPPPRRLGPGARGRPALQQGPR